MAVNVEDLQKAYNHVGLDLAYTHSLGSVVSGSRRHRLDLSPFTNHSSYYS